MFSSSLGQSCGRQDTAAKTGEKDKPPNQETYLWSEKRNGYRIKRHFTITERPFLLKSRRAYKSIFRVMNSVLTGCTLLYTVAKNRQRDQSFSGADLRAGSDMVEQQNYQNLKNVNILTKKTKGRTLKKWRRGVRQINLFSVFINRKYLQIVGSRAALSGDMDHLKSTRRLEGGACAMYPVKEKQSQESVQEE